MIKISWPSIDSDHLVIYSKQMSELENQMFSSGLPEESLMEKAGILISHWLLNRKKLLKNGVIIFIGPGHNGGDGAVLARELFLKGVAVKIWTPLPIKKKLTINYLNSTLQFLTPNFFLTLMNQSKHKIFQIQNHRLKAQYQDFYYYFYLKKLIVGIYRLQYYQY